MIKGRTTWGGGDAWEAVRAAAEARLRDAVELLRGEIADVLGVAYPPASRPGEAPRRRRGVLQRAVKGEVDPAALTGRVYVDELAAPYGAQLEGERHRPFFAVTVGRCLPRVRAILQGGGDG